MPTMLQKAQQINSDRLDIISAINTKNPNANLPSTTGTGALAAAVSAIPTGGTNPFMTMTDLKYMFDYRNSGDDLVMNGIETFKNNAITDLNHAFYYFNDNRYLTVPAEANRFLNDLKYYLTHFSTADKQYIMNCFKSGNWASTYNMELDLSDAQIVGSSIEYGFGSMGHNSANMGQFVIALGQNTIKDINCRHLFERIAKNIKIKLVDGRLNLANNCNDLFYYSEGSFIDSNNNNLTELNISVQFPSTGTYTLANLFNLSTSRVTESDPVIERVNFLDFDNVKGVSSMFGYCYGLKSITGLDFSKIDSSSVDLFSVSYGKYFDKLGEFGIVNNSVLGYFITNLKLNKIWNASADTIRDGQTIGYWYEKFANALGNKVRDSAQTITINTTLYNSLTQAQKELITDKGYTLASGT